MAQYFYSLFEFLLALWAHQNMAQFLKILSNTTHQIFNRLYKFNPFYFGLSGLCVLLKALTAEGT